MFKNVFFSKGIKPIALMACWLIIFSGAKGQILAWQFGNPASTGDEATFTATTIVANLNSSSLSRGSGLTASTLARGFSSSGYPSGETKANAITNNRYYQFTIQASSGYKVSLSTLDARLRRSGASSPNAYIWRYSIDGINFTDIGSDVSFTSTADGVDQTQISLSGITALQNVTNPTIITFRLYAWGASASGTTFAIGRYSSGVTTNSLSIGGTVASAATANLNVGSLSNQFGNVCINTTTGYETFTVSGSNLDGSSVAVGTKSGFTYCLTDNGTYTSTLNLPYTAPTLSSTTVYVKFNPTAVTSYTGTIPVTGGGASATGCSVTSAAGVNSVPTLTTGSSSGTNFYSSTCAGTITNNGCSAISAYGIEWSTTNNFTPGTGTQVSSSNINANNYTSLLTGLPSNTTIYYRAYATNSGGTGWGSQSSFTTSVITAPTATAASNVGIHSFRANWNIVVGATSYRLDVSTSSSFTSPVQDDVVFWNFPNSPDDATADGGITSNLSATITTQGGTSALDFSFGGASSRSARATNWDNGSGTKYWQVIFNTQNYYNLKISSKQRSSGSGPKDFKLQYKIGAGGTWTDVTGGTITVADNYTSGVLNSLSLPSECENQSSVYLRWIMTSNNQVTSGTVASGGASNIDDIFVTGYEGDFVIQNQTVNALFYDVNNLDPSTTYHYRVRAFYNSNVSANSNTINVTTLGVCDLLTINPTNSSPICQGGTVNLFANAAGSDGTITGYQWSGPGGYASTIENPTIVNPTGGTYTVTVTDDNGCNLSNTTTVTVVPAATVNAGGNQTMCTAATSYTLSAASASNYSSLSWTTSGTGSFNDNTLLHPIYTPSVADKTAGSVTLTLNAQGNSPCGTASNNMTLTIEALPTANAGTDAYTCSNSSASLNGMVGGSATGGTWTTAGDGSFVPNNTTLNAAYVPGATDISNGTAVLTLTTTGSAACAATNDQVTITVQTGIPSQPTPVTGAPASVCPPAGPYTLSTSSTNANTYNWYVTGANTGITFLSANGSNSMNVSYGTTANSSYTIRVEASNACGTSAYRAAFTRRTVSTPAAVTGTTVVCANTSGNYTCTAVDGAESYQWTITGDATVTGTTNSVTVNFGPAWTGGTLCVSSKVGCFTSPQKCLTLTTASPALGTLNGATFTACPNSVLSFNVAAVAGVQSYNWTTPTNSSVTSGAGTNNIQVTFNNSYSAVGNICVSSTSICGVTSAPKCKTVAPGLPSVPASITGGTNGLCNQSANFSCPVQVGASYTWTAPGTITNNGSNSVSIQFGSFSTGSVCVTATNNCGTSAPRCVSIKGAPNSPTAITSNPAVICANTSGVEFTANTSNITGSYTLAWSYPAAAATYVSGGGNSNQIILDWGNANGTVIVSATNACGTGSKTYPVTLSCRESNQPATALTLFPNPASGNVNINLTSEVNRPEVVLITDLSGKVVMQQQVALVTGYNNFTFDLNQMAKGAYLVRLQGSNAQPQKLIIQ